MDKLVIKPGKVKGGTTGEKYENQIIAKSQVPQRYQRQGKHRPRSRYSTSEPQAAGQRADCSLSQLRNVQAGKETKAAKGQQVSGDIHFSKPWGEVRI